MKILDHKHKFFNNFCPTLPHFTLLYKCIVVTQFSYLILPNSVVISIFLVFIDFCKLPYFFNFHTLIIESFS